MKVGVYFDLRNPPQWRQSPSRLYGFALEACQEAERLGAGSAWFSEHHLFEDDYLCAPLTFAAAAAARTQRIRLGTAIVIAPLHHPAEIAEQSAVVDLVSDGRLDLGLGAGYRVPEFALFDAPMSARYGRTDGTVRRLRGLWGKDGIRPGPIQDPLPIWLGYQGPKGARRAGLLGEGLLSADAPLWGPYSDGLAEWCRTPCASAQFVPAPHGRRHRPPAAQARRSAADRQLRWRRPVGVLHLRNPGKRGRKHPSENRWCAGRHRLPVGVHRRHERRARHAQHRDDLHPARTLARRSGAPMTHPTPL